MSLDAGQIPEGFRADPPALGRDKPRKGKVVLKTLGDLDARTVAFRRAKQLIKRIQDDHGGAARMTETQRQLAHHAALAAAMIEDWHAKWLSGEAVDAEAYSAMVNSHRRLLAAIGPTHSPTPEELSDEALDTRIDQLVGTVVDLDRQEHGRLLRRLGLRLVPIEEALS